MRFIVIGFVVFYLSLIKSEAKVIDGAKNTKITKDSWSGPWFPFPPETETIRSNLEKFTQRIEQLKCNGDGSVDKPKDSTKGDKRSSFNYLCMDQRAKYLPNATRSAVIREYYMPPAYEAPMICPNEKITYDHYPPTFGAYYALVPKLGIYRYLPPETWLGSVVNEIVVALYHPCAPSAEVKRLHKILEGRATSNYLMTTSQHLTAERPFAVVAWGRSLQMSFVEENNIMDFIHKFIDHYRNTDNVIDSASS